MLLKKTGKIYDYNEQFYLKIRNLCKLSWHYTVATSKTADKQLPHQNVRKGMNEQVLNVLESQSNPLFKSSKQKVLKC